MYNYVNALPYQYGTNFLKKRKKEKKKKEERKEPKERINKNKIKK